MTSPVYVGVDNGGTWIRMVGLDARRRRVWSLKKPSPTVPDLPAFLKKTLKRFHGDLSGLAVGSRGVWKQSKRRWLKNRLHGLAKEIIVMSDVEAAWLAAFRSQGILIISGTGSIAYGRTASGKFARAGGLGPDKGDEGSGYWIGKEWLNRSGRARERGSESSIRNIAALAPKVIQKAKFDNPVALAIIRVAQGHLAELVREVADKLHWKGRIPLSVSGSVLQNDWFLRGFLREVKNQKILFRFTPAKQDVARSLALLLYRKGL
jgi:N-acetylglucosamine kinase-like BadF-type ATPase